jgi:dihydroorotase
VNPDIFKARERGFIFDLGHGAGSFEYRNAAPANEQGYLPDSISTDLHGANTCGPAVNMANVMSKILSLGVSLKDVIRLSTVAPAKNINHSELGTLSIGGIADIAVFELQSGDFSFVDTSGGRQTGNRRIQPMLTIAGGAVAFDPWGMSYPEWRNVPQDNAYWKNPSGQPW